MTTILLPNNLFANSFSQKLKVTLRDVEFSVRYERGWKHKYYKGRLLYSEFLNARIYHGLTFLIFYNKKRQLLRASEYQTRQLYAEAGKHTDFPITINIDDGEEIRKIDLEE